MIGLLFRRIKSVKLVGSRGECELFRLSIADCSRTDCTNYVIVILENTFDMNIFRKDMVKC